MTEGRFDPQIWARRRLDETVPALAWQPQSLPAMRGWQRRLRARLRALMGLPERPRGPVQAHVMEERDFGAYRRETVRFEGQTGLDCFGYFLVPTSAPLNSPAILCLPGTGGAWRTSSASVRTAASAD